MLMIQDCACRFSVFQTHRFDGINVSEHTAPVKNIASSAANGRIQMNPIVPLPAHQ